MPGWTWAALARSTGAEWIGQAPHQPLQRKARPVVPAFDSFYRPPAGFEHARPGTVLRSRDVELAFLGLVPQKLSATQLLYRTTDLNGAPEVAVTTVVVPTERACAAAADRLLPVRHRRGRRALLPVLRAAPTRQAVGAVAQFEFVLVAASLAEGWAVSVPDHEGTAGMWGAPYEPGYHVLDGVRAAINHDSPGLTPESPIGLWGYSGGGLATAWAAEVQGSYAPELNVVGAVLGSPVGDLGHTFKRLNGSVYSGLPAMVVAALSHLYPDLDRVIQEHATDEGKAMLARIERMTTAHAMLRLAGKDMATMVDRPLEEILLTPEVQHVFDSIKLGTAAPTRAGAHRAGRARPDHLRRRHRRVDRDLHAGRRQSSPTTATCSASICCCIRCRRR